MQDEVVWRVARAVFLADQSPSDWPREPEAFAARVALCRPRLYAEGLEALRRLRLVLQAVQALHSALQQAAGAHEVAVKDMQAQLAGLFARDFIRAMPPALWQRLAVYVQAASKRLERLKQNPERERQARAQLEPVLARLGKLKSTPPPFGKGGDNNLPDDLNMMLEEWRVQLFAQELKTAMPVSLARVNALLEAAGG
jgi:ATP-dependent helicase HrpA